MVTYLLVHESPQCVGGGGVLARQRARLLLLRRRCCRRRLAAPRQQSLGPAVLLLSPSRLIPARSAHAHLRNRQAATQSNGQVQC